MNNFLASWKLEFEDGYFRIFDSNEIEIEWFNCDNKAEEWKIEHLP